MALIDRLARDAVAAASGLAPIATHAFSAALWQFAKGEFTQQNVIDAFALTADDQVQLDQLIAFYQALPAAQKTEFHQRLETAGVLLEEGFITRAKYKSLLGMT
jgi:hypothetical protein